MFTYVFFLYTLPTYPSPLFSTLYVYHKKNEFNYIQIFYQFKVSSAMKKTNIETNAYSRTVFLNSLPSK